MTEAFYVAVPYDIEELGPEETGHEIWEYLKCGHYDCRGYGGEVLPDNRWQTVWVFASEAEANRFAKDGVASFSTRPRKSALPSSASLKSTKNGRRGNVTPQTDSFLPADFDIEGNTVHICA